MNSILQNAKEYFYHKHDVECNQKYNKTLPYSFHLEMVNAQADLFNHIPLFKYDEQTHLNIRIAIYGHDSIEDARLSYNDIKIEFNEDVAEMIYLCTENKGRNRADRKDITFYTELSKNKPAVFVKLCDLIANVKFSLLTNSSMFNKYESEYKEKVVPYLKCDEFNAMFTYLDKLFTM
jgi:(p)ppGpp synthase/HD superfamily hydrolase